jgi:hypothetical protein
MTSTPLSNRFGDIFQCWAAARRLRGRLDRVLKDRSALLNFSQRVERTKLPMELRYNQDMDDYGLDWEYTERVLSSRDLDKWVRQGW